MTSKLSQGRTNKRSPDERSDIWDTSIDLRPLLTIWRRANAIPPYRAIFAPVSAFGTLVTTVVTYIVAK
jgi:hypothetical protein